MDSPTDRDGVRRVVEDLTARGIDVLRVGYPDLMGTERSREVLVEQLPAVLEHGLAFCRAVFHTTTRGETLDVAGGLDAGLPDVKVFPDLSTIADIPWEEGVASCLGDVFDPSGEPSDESPRTVLRGIVEAFHATGRHPVVGPELEYFVLERDGDGWRRYGDESGNIYVTGAKGDPDGHLTATLRHLRDFGLGVTAGNHEFCPGQFEVNLAHSAALDSVDRAFRFKSAIKELERRAGRMATFMAKPFNGEGASGFHLHVSLTDEDGRNVGVDPAGEFGLAPVLRHALAGVLTHAPALAALANPTVNSYKRFGPDTLAPWLIDWGLDNRSAMVRVPPERGEATRIELRLPDSSANPYLLYGGVLAAMQLGIEAGAEPPAPLDGYGYDPAKAPVLPTSLSAALDAFEADAALQGKLGKRLAASFTAFKRDEVERYRSWVSDWELREYVNHL
ncbi:glutamine synthetase family protein [Amycolatopsis samaneae]|uniref:Glutamine synthetase family protein n=1 Tax=Amycolatopsis samaneae TaxID=664691 RepID=A0ABW5GPQ3_9PSEU